MFITTYKCCPIIVMMQRIIKTLKVWDRNQEEPNLEDVVL